MPLLCYGSSKKRSNKRHVGSVGKINNSNNNSSREDSSNANRLSNGRQPIFAMVLQDYTASAPDELTIQRSQLVEVMNSDGEWLYVRNMDTGGGYVPKNFCIDLNQMKGNFNNVPAGSITGPAPRPQSINVDTLQRSGSSVSSVEVHQITNNPSVAAGDSTGGPRPLREESESSSSSSQVIYEVPRSPGNRPLLLSSVQADAGTPPPQRAPVLPPRSAHLLQSPVDVQQNVIQYSSHSVAGQAVQHHPQHHHQQHRPSFLAHIQENSRLTHTPPTTTTTTTTSPPYYTPNTPNTHTPGTRLTPASNCSPLYPSHPQFPGTNHHHHPLTRTSPGSNPPPQMLGSPLPTSPPEVPASKNRPPVPPNVPFPSNFVRNSQASSMSPPGHHHSSSSPSSSSARNPHHLPQNPVRIPPATVPMASAILAEFSPVVAGGTPGSAGFPGLAASPTSARVALTPGSSSSPPGIPPGLAGTPGGCVAVPIWSAATPGAVGVETTSRWLGANSHHPPYNQRGLPTGGSRRCRRYSSDIVLVDSTISEIASETTDFSYPQNSQRLQTRRQSQPCIEPVDHTIIPHRPTRLPVRRSLSMHENSRMNPAVSPVGNCPIRARVKPIPIRRASSYQEAVLTEDERRFGVAAAGTKPSEVANSSSAVRGGRRSRGRSGHTDSCQSTSASDCEPVEVDDVFLPDEKKPLGIFRCVRAYMPKFKGEIGLEENELAIVLDYGRGEWAWVITSTNTEGLIPKSVLVRLDNPILETGGASTARNGNGIDASTQTQADEEVFPHEDSGASSCTASALASAESNASSPSSTMRNRRKKTTFVVPELKPSDPRPKEWFDTIDSIDDREQTVVPKKSTASTSSHTSSLSSPTSKTAGKGVVSEECSVAHKYTKVVMRKRKAASLPHSISPPPPPPSAARDGTAMRRVTSDTVHNHNRVSGLGSISFEGQQRNVSLSKQICHPGKKPSMFLTAIKDYSPPPTTKNCLPLKKGDVFHLQPHMHYPKGWMWVWHTGMKSFGYVPKSYVAYAYDTPPKDRRRTDTVEDAV